VPANVFAAEPTAEPTTQPASAPSPEVTALKQRVDPAITKAMQFLTSGQAKDGGWHMPPPGAEVGVSGLVVKCFIQHPAYGPRHPVSKAGIAFLLKNQQPDGGIYTPRSPYANYTTSVALMALSSAKDPALAKAIAGAQRYLAFNQWQDGKKDDAGKPIDPKHSWYGGAGYGHATRPDLSNTQFMLEALHESELPADDPVYQRALIFISRCQMSGQTNDQPLAEGVDDGGFIYSPANGGESKAGTVTVAGKPHLRSYGTMTYSGFKSLLYAGLTRKDPRVRQAWEWIRRYYTLDENPNMPGAQSKEGLYYFFHVFARALDTWGEPVLVDAKGTRHDWRADLVKRLLELQRPDGSWVNGADRWQEGNAYLVTAYSVLSLQAALP
jgi:squalene-hopene/tetraprenyl-beta-curcumene cyclase